MVYAMGRSKLVKAIRDYIFFLIENFYRFCIINVYGCCVERLGVDKSLDNLLDSSFSVWEIP